MVRRQWTPVAACACTVCQLSIYSGRRHRRDVAQERVAIDEERRCVERVPAAGNADQGSFGVIERSSAYACAFSTADDRGQKTGAYLTRPPLSEMARRVMSRCYLAHRGLLHAAALDSIGAARVEAAAAGWVDRARHLAREDDALAPRAWIGERNR
jgi:hypothetical protein